MDNGSIWSMHNHHRKVSSHVLTPAPLNMWSHSFQRNFCTTCFLLYSIESLVVLLWKLFFFEQNTNGFGNM